MRQTVTRLTPLSDVRSLIETEVKPVALSEREIAAAIGCALGEDVAAPRRPETSIALQDGWALRADETLGASAYAPALLTQTPPQIETGQKLPAGCDCVAAFDDVRISGVQAEVLAVLSSGDGVLAAGGDCDGGAPLIGMGARLRALQAAALDALGIATVRVRTPRVLIASVRSDAILQAAQNVIAGDAQRRVGIIETTPSLDAALANANVDLTIIIGGTGNGENDRSVAALARAGKVAVHGIALSPGETSAIGFAAGRPVLLLPGRLDAAIAGWLMLGRQLMDKLSGLGGGERPELLALARKITSKIGVTEVMPVRRVGDKTEPLAAQFWPLSAIARADGYVVISPESEGSSAGSTIQVWPWA